MARAIVRYSLNEDQGQGEGPKIDSKWLRGTGFRNIGTRTWQLDDVEHPEALTATASLLERLRDLKAPVRLDHVWVYIDSVD